MRSGMIATLGASALLAWPAGADAVVLGADVGQLSGTFQSCTVSPHCTYVQTRITDRITKAPFTGRLTRWRVQEPYGTLRIQVVKRLPGGEFKAIRSSDGETVLTSEDAEVHAFDTDLHIRKGQYVAIAPAAFYSSHLNSANADPATCFKGIVPGILDGEMGSSNPSYDQCEKVLLYNATLKH